MTKKNAFTFYRSDSGRIVGNHIGCFNAANTPDHCEVIRGFFPPEHYYIDITTQQAKPLKEFFIRLTKETINVANKESGSFIGIPEHTQCQFGDDCILVSDTDFAFTIDQPGEYRVVFQNPKYLPKEFVVNAV